MLPFILGGIAVAVTGYKIKQLFEDIEFRDKLDDVLIQGYDRLFDSPTGSFTPLLNTFTDPYILFCLGKKQTITSLKDAFELLQGIRHHEWSSLLNSLENFHFEQTSDIGKLNDEEAKTKIRKFCQIALKAKSHYVQILDELNSVVLKETDYTKYTEETKEKVYWLTMLTVMLHQAVALLSDFNDETLNRTTMRVFEKLKMFIEEDMAILISKE